MNTKIYRITVSEEAYKRTNELIKISKEDHAANRITREQLASMAILNVNKEQVIELSRKNRSLKDVVNSYFSNHKENNSADGLLSFLKQQAVTKEQ